MPTCQISEETISYFTVSPADVVTDDGHSEQPPSHRSSSYEFYDEMNDLDALYKEIHCSHNQFDVLLSSLEAILRVIFYLFVFSLCLLCIVNVASDKVVLFQTYHQFLNAISSLASPQFFLHSTCSSLATRACETPHAHILLH